MLFILLAHVTTFILDDFKDVLVNSKSNFKINKCGNSLD